MLGTHRIGRASLGLAALTASACHVIVPTETTRPVARERIAHPELAVARQPRIVLTDAGQLRFVIALECPTDELVRQHTTIERATRPNLATFTVGVIAMAAGGVLLTSGLFSDKPGASPLTYVGGAGLAVGVPFAVGPWLGNHRIVRDSDNDPPPLRRPGPPEPCGERALPAGRATLTTAGLEIHGTIDDTGTFAIAPYQWLDAYAPSFPAVELIAEVELGTEHTSDPPRGANHRSITTVIEPSALAQRAPAFLARADFDAKLAPLRLVPGLTAGALRINLVTTPTGPALRVVLPLRNDGPGDAYGLRGQLAAPNHPALDGRMIYIGKLARNASIARELVIPLAPATAAALHRATLDLSIELRDAHGTAPSTPVRFHGAVP